MKPNEKKHIIKESELKEIIREMVLNEIEQTDIPAFSTMAQKELAKGGRVGMELKDYGKAIGDFLKGIIPQNWREKLGNWKGTEWASGALGLNSPQGHKGPDYVPDAKTWGVFGGKGWGTGNNKDAKEVLNVQKACRHIINNSSAKSTNWCARHVRQALNWGGLSAPWGMYAPSAKYYINILPANGWYEISPSEAGQPCDIVVMNAFTTLDTHKLFKNGHIAMCVGNGRWISDFRQATTLGIKGKVPPEAVHYYRYKNLQ